ncbi:RhuM family protein [Treponema sp. JC4]|uniref:RhuM family protein n=1 Tax=Treponema sp. JC4 TaxID=1124982 RepID=UPI0005868F25|nr:RhuM family protein [Treponema sp. JC4]
MIISPTCRKFRQVQNEDNQNVSREILFYNLDMIISLGYRIKSKITTLFRQWATRKDLLIGLYTWQL